MSTVVHFVHLVHAVHGGHGGGLLGFGDDFADHRLGYSNLGGDVTIVQTLLVEFYNTHIALDDVVVIRFGEVVFLRLRVQEVEADHVIVFAEFEDHHGTGSVGETSVTDFQLLDEAEVFVLGTEADGEDAVNAPYRLPAGIIYGIGCAVFFFAGKVYKELGDLLAATRIPVWNVVLFLILTVASDLLDKFCPSMILEEGVELAAYVVLFMTLCLYAFNPIRRVKK